MKEKRASKLFYSLLVFIILTLLSLQSPIGITFFPLIMIFTAPILFILWLLKVEKIKKIPVKGYAIPLMTAVVLSFFCSVGIIKYQRTATIESSSILINALEKYRNEKSSYPANLDVLKPQFISEIPKTKMGWYRVNFDYKTENNMKVFKLGFKYIAMLRCFYDSEMNGWVYE
ncbi:MAG: hypothetical protein ABSF32_10090 [Ignavibacteria bacterium]|jgi:hypothetical protein